MKKKNDRNYLLESLEMLVGGTIVSVDTQAEDEEWQQWPIIRVKKDDIEYELMVSRDDEGNGPGTIFGLPDPDKR